jgi:uncharacterized sulfatase
LPEIEIHTRLPGTPPHTLARDPSHYPLERILGAAELASRLDPAALPKLKKLLADPDSAVRYWAALGYLMRGPEIVAQGEDVLRSALNDSSPCVCVVAAQALGLHGRKAARAPTLTVLAEHAPPKKNGVLVSMSALAAIEALGEKGAWLRELVRNLNRKGPSPDERYNSYVPSLIKNIIFMTNNAAPPPRPEATVKDRTG